MEVAVYLPETTQQQDEATSKDLQETLCVSLPKWLGHRVAPSFVLREISPGADFERPALTVFRRLARTSGFNKLVVYSRDTLSRDPIELLTLLNEFGECGVQVHFVQGVCDATG